MRRSGTVEPMSSADPQLQRPVPVAANDALAPAPAVRPARARSRLRGRQQAAQPGDGANSPAGLDDVDLRLLRILQADGRITNLKLAAAVGLSSASTHERVRRLVRDGVILGFSA